MSAPAVVAEPSTKQLCKVTQEVVNRRGSVSTDGVLDWLCFHLDQSQLPVKFAAGAQSAAGDNVKVVVRADPDAVASSRCAAAGVKTSPTH